MPRVLVVRAESPYKTIDDLIEDGVLTCQMHGWRWQLSDGKCLSSVGHDLHCAPVGEPVPAMREVVGLTAPLLPADLLRNIARYAGCHIYTEENDVVIPIVVIVGMIAVWDNKASAVVVASPLRKIWSTERVGVGFRLFNRFFPAGVPTRI